MHRQTGSHRITWAAVLLALPGFISGCISMTAEPKSSATVFGESPTSEAVAQTYEATFDDVFQAADDVIARKGLFVEHRDRDRGIIRGNGKYQMMCGGGPCQMSVAFAVYVTEVSAEPRTRAAVDLKRFGYMGYGSENYIKNTILIEIQKLLATSR